MLIHKMLQVLQYKLRLSMKRRHSIKNYKFQTFNMIEIRNHLLSMVIGWGEPGHFSSNANDNVVKMGN